MLWRLIYYLLPRPLYHRHRRPHGLTIVATVVRSVPMQKQQRYKDKDKNNDNDEDDDDDDDDDEDDEDADLKLFTADLENDVAPSSHTLHRHLFLHKPSKDLLCGICFGIVRQPLNLLCCHLFC